MKKTIAILAMGVLGYSASAQELTSKKGFPILPEANDWSISFDAVPFLDYAFDKTRIMSGTPASSAAGSLNYSIGNTIVGKMMKDANTAYRVKARLGFTRVSADTYVDKVGSTTGETVVNNATESSSNITLGAGLQYYRGKGRLRGYYGAEAELGISSGPSETFTYGNALSTDNPASRVTSDKSGMGFNLGARGFIGAEYFFAPKMSIGAEFGWGLGFGVVGEGEEVSEEFDFTNSSVKKTTKKVGGGSGFGMDVDNAGGSINLAIYF